MILGIGTDIVQVDRFKSWKKYSREQLLKIFSECEINYCCKDGDLKNVNVECLASRFAAKEAFFKAFSQFLIHINYTQVTFSFLFSCKNVEVVKGMWDVPHLKIDWKLFEEKIGRHLPKFQTRLSLSHEKDVAISFVILFK